jgi:hypothetical protein
MQKVMACMVDYHDGKLTGEACAAVTGMICHECRNECINQLWDLEAEGMENLTFRVAFWNLTNTTPTGPRSALGCDAHRHLATTEVALLVP